MSESEQIVFVDTDGRPTGETGPKLASHTANTRLHLAFSCYVLRKSDNKLLATQRALRKKVWPGVWTNSICGHPQPGESMEAAIRRRAQDELGLTQLEEVACLLPDFTYKTPPFNGIVENEFCPVFIAYTGQEPKANPDEVEAYKWMDWPEYAKLLQADKANKTTYWAKAQYDHLKQLEPFRSLHKPKVAGKKVDLRRGIDHIGAAVVALIYDDEGRILLIKRGPGARDEQGHWDVIGGAIEFGESIDEAVRREVREELSTEIVDIEFLTIYDAHRTHTDGRPTHWIALAHIAKVEPSKVKIGEPDKIAQLGWFYSHELPSPLHSQFWKNYQPALDRGVVK